MSAAISRRACRASRARGCQAGRHLL